MSPAVLCFLAAVVLFVAYVALFEYPRHIVRREELRTAERRKREERAA